MDDVLIARGGFADDTGLMRLSHAARLTVRTVETTLDGVGSDHFDARPACVVFATSGSTSHQPGSPRIEDAVRALSRRYPEVAFVAVLVDGALASEQARSAATVTLLDAGADEVLVSTICASELAARVAAVVRRLRRGPVAACGSVALAARPSVDPARRELVGSGGRAAMTAKEAVIMGVLLARESVVTRAECEAALWTGPWRGTPKAVDMHIAKLRPKVMAVTCGSWQIETIRGAGFLLAPCQRDEPRPEQYCTAG